MPEANERGRWMAMLAQGATAAAVCARFGITPPTLRKWRRRFERDGVAGLEDTSRAPGTRPGRKVFAEGEALILRLRRDEGLGVHRLCAALRERHGITLSADTVLKVLRRAGEETLPPGRRRGATRAVAGPLPVDAASARPGAAAAIAGLITAGMLRPGEKLSEAALASRLGTGRTLVREALKQLAMTGLVVLERHRGAFVAQPSLEEVRQAYEARQVIEGAIVADVAAHCTAHDVRALRRHVQRQRDASAAGNRHELVRLLTDFHLAVAALGGNRVMEAMLASLTAKTSLAVMVYDHGGQPSCAIEEHVALVDMLARGDAPGAGKLMRSHLTSNAERLEPGRGGTEE